MKRNKLFLLSSIVIIIFILSTAATCNFCGATMDLGENADETDKASQIEEIPGQQRSQTDNESESNQQTVEEEESSESVEDVSPSEAEDNHPPVIESITIDGTEISGDSEILVSEVVLFEIYASDEDGDEIVFTANSTCGDIIELVRVNDEMAAFGWGAPDSSGFCTVTINVSDGTDEVSRNVEIVVYDVRTALSLHGNVYKDLCGFIVKNEMVYPPDTSLILDGTIFVGDMHNDRESKGYISFDISDIWEAAPDAEVNVEFVNLAINNITSEGNPNDVGDYLVIKEEKYGTELTLDDFTFTGRHLAQFSTTGLTNLSITNETLIDALEIAINNEEQYFQIKMGLSSPTNDDAVRDGYWINLGAVVLAGGYNRN